MSIQIEYFGSNFNTEVIKKWTRAQLVEHLRSQFMPLIPLHEVERREAAAGDLWDLYHPKKEDNADGKTVVGKVAVDGGKPNGNNRSNRTNGK